MSPCDTAAGKLAGATAGLALGMAGTAACADGVPAVLGVGRTGNMRGNSATGAGLDPEHETSRMAAPYARARVTQPLLRLSSGGGLEMRSPARSGCEERRATRCTSDVRSLEGEVSSDGWDVRSIEGCELR